MAEQKKINPMLKMALELGPIVLFFVAYTRLRDRTFDIGGQAYDGFIVATALFIPLIVVTTLILWKLTGHLSKMQIATVVLVVVFGGLSVWLNDDRFFKMKPTMIYTLFAGVLGYGLLRGKSYLRFVMEEMMPLEHEGWMILTRRLFWTFLGLAAANEVIWRTMSTDTWVKIETFAFPVVLMGILFWQIMALQEYLIEAEEAQGDQ